MKSFEIAVRKNVIKVLTEIASTNNRFSEYDDERKAIELEHAAEKYYYDVLGISSKVIWNEIKKSVQEIYGWY